MGEVVCFECVRWNRGKGLDSDFVMRPGSLTNISFYCVDSVRSELGIRMNPDFHVDISVAHVYRRFVTAYSRVSTSG